MYLFWYWRLNLGPCTFEASTLPLSPVFYFFILGHGLTKLPRQFFNSLYSRDWPMAQPPECLRLQAVTTKWVDCILVTCTYWFYLSPEDKCNLSFTWKSLRYWKDYYSVLPKLSIVLAISCNILCHLLPKQFSFEHITIWQQNLKFNR